MICSKCGLEIGNGARFCPKCGAEASREIAGRYRLFEKLGEGAMGAVYRGDQISLKRTVAVKLLKPELSADGMLVRRFISEAEAIAKLSHPNTVNIYDFGQDRDGSLFIVMEFVDGQTLRAVVQGEAPFTPTRALVIAAQIAASLADAHSRSIVHRDLKPDNVMLQARGKQKDIARVLDFGIAKLREDNRATRAALTQAGDLLGTPQYMAPEQVVGDPVDGRTDIYALGCMIYEMVTARRPFDATTVTEMLTKHLNESVVPPTARRPDLGIPIEIDRLVLMAMMKQPVARPPTMELFGEQIAAVLATLPREERSSSEILPSTRPSPSAPVGSLSTVATGHPYAPATPPSGSRPYAPVMQTPPSGSQPYVPVIQTPPPGGFVVGRVTAAPGAATPRGMPAAAMPASVTPGTGMPGASQPYPPLSASDVALAPHKSRDGLYIALGVIAIALIGGGVWFALREHDEPQRIASRTAAPPAPAPPPAEPPTTPTQAPAASAQPPAASAQPPAASAQPPAASAQPPATPTHLPATLPSDLQGHGPTTPSGHDKTATKLHPLPPPTTIDAGAAEPETPAAPARPAGEIVKAAQGLELIVPAGFKVQRQGANVIAQSPGYTIVIGPITSKLRDPEARAREYAEATGLTLDGVVPVELSGVRRSGAAFHGTLYNEEVAQSIIDYTGAKYRMAVSLTMPYAARNDPTVRAFADDLFGKRVIVP